MGELHLGAVKEQTLKPSGPPLTVCAGISVGGVHQYRMVESSEVASDLMKAPGVGLSLNEGTAGLLRPTEHSDRGAGFLLFASSVRTERALDQTVDGTRTPAYEGEVGLLAVCEGLLADPGGLRGRREQQAAAGGPIEPVYWIDVLSYLISDTGQHHIAIGRQAGSMNEDPSRLVDNQPARTAGEDLYQ